MRIIWILVAMGLGTFLIVRNVSVEKKAYQQKSGIGADTRTDPSPVHLRMVDPPLKIRTQALTEYVLTISNDNKKVTFYTLDDSANLCIAKTSTHPEICVSYKAFKKWQGVQ